MLRAWLNNFLVVLILGVSLQSNAAPPAVGRIALSVGGAQRIDAEGRSAPLRLGALISEGDRIITGGDAVAVIVFVDEARISLRADSELLVKQYKIDPVGTDTRLHFELVRGSIRQISGQAARQQPDRYRLNTPIAAVGVRGTDFLAKTTADALETFVQEGKIVVLPKQSACIDSPQAGLCASLADLSATDTARYLRILIGGQIERRVVLPDEIERLFGISLVSAPVLSAPLASATPSVTAMAKLATPTKAAEPTVAAVSATDSWPRNAQISTDVDKAHTELPAGLTNLIARTPNSAPLPVNTPVVAVVAPVPVEVVPTPIVVEPAPVVVQPVVEPVVVPVPTPVAKPDPTPVLPPVPEVVVAPEPARQLVWGRFDSADQLPLQLLAPYSTAKEGRSVTMGELGQYALWRTGPTQSLPASLKGQAQFALHAGEAYFQQGSQKLVASITNPYLSVDFDRALFNTSLTVSQAQVGAATINASGKLSDEGLFLSLSTGQRVAGAVSYDGTEAGYLFSKDHASGVFKGITLWNAR